MLLLFCLSLFPFGTAWMGQSNLQNIPVAVYGVILLAAALAFTVLVRSLIRIQPDHTLADAIGSDRKGIVSLVGYLVAIPVALIAPIAAFVIFVLVALLWFVPDKRIERTLAR